MERITINESGEPALQQGVVLSSFANRCLELIEHGNNTFQIGWDDAIQELITAGMIEAECGADGVVRVRKIA
jgi:hypothetical protein